MSKQVKLKMKYLWHVDTSIVFDKDGHYIARLPLSKVTVLSGIGNLVRDELVEFEIPAWLVRNEKLDEWVVPEPVEIPPENTRQSVRRRA